MKKKEVIELFSIMMLAWPAAEVFKGGVQKLEPTIQLWTTCLADVDFWTAKQAVIRLCKESQFPPTIAGFEEKVEQTRREIDENINQCIAEIRSADFLRGSLDDYYAELPNENIIKMVISAMGGPENLIIIETSDGNKASRWNWEGFKKAYWRICKKQSALSSAEIPLLENQSTRRS